MKYALLIYGDESVQPAEGSDAFTEMYLLVASPDGWKIAAIADNRQATQLPTATASMATD